MREPDSSQQIPWRVLLLTAAFHAALLVGAVFAFAPLGLGFGPIGTLMLFVAGVALGGFLKYLLSGDSAWWAWLAGALSGAVGLLFVFAVLTYGFAHPVGEPPPFSDHLVSLLRLKNSAFWILLTFATMGLLSRVGGLTARILLGRR
jgi:hypothetical protein